MCRMVGVVFRREFPMEILDDLCRLSEVGIIPGEEEKGQPRASATLTLERCIYAIANTQFG